MENVQFDTREEFESFAKAAKRRHQLHPLVEKSLKQLLMQLYPDSHPVSEVIGVIGGRHDLMQFAYSGRRIVFELFFSPSQVPQDLRLLEQSSADVKIAVLLDRNINPKLADAYFRKKPDPFPFLWLSHILLSHHRVYCLARLRELISEKPIIERMRLALAKRPDLEELVGRKLAEIEKLVRNQNRKSEDNGKFTGNQLLALLIIQEIRKLGVPVSRLRSLYAWLQDKPVLSRVLSMVELGYPTFLITDAQSQHAIWGALDLSDYLFLNLEQRKKADVIVCVNRIVNEFMEKLGYEREPLRFRLSCGLTDITET